MEPDFYLRVFLFLKAKQSLATLTKDVPKRHSLAMPTETVVNGNNQEWVMQADLPLTAAIRQSQQTLYVHAGHPTDRQGRVTRTQHILPRGHILCQVDSVRVVVDIFFISGVSASTKVRVSTNKCFWVFFC